MNGKAFTIPNTRCLSELSRIMADKTPKKSVSLTDDDVQTFLEGEENQYSKRKTESCVFNTIRTPRLSFGDCRFIYFHSLMKLACLPIKGLLCLYDKQNNTWLLLDIEFFFSCSTRHLTRSLRSLVSYLVKHSKSV